MARTEGEVPEALDRLVRGRDDSPLPEGALVRYQQIGLTPGIASNHRFVLLDDGGLLGAANTGRPPADRDERFNTPLPQSPTGVVPETTMARVREALAAPAFASAPPFVGEEGVRDGSVVIVTARVADRIHEVWFQNATTELTDLLAALPGEVTGADEPDLDALLAELEAER